MAAQQIEQATSKLMDDGMMDGFDMWMMEMGLIPQRVGILNDKQRTPPDHQSFVPVLFILCCLFRFEIQRESITKHL